MTMESARYFARDCSGKRTPRRETDTTRIIGELLLRFGITPHLKGFEPLREEVRITVECERGSERPSLVELQPTVGKLCGERNPAFAARDAISVGFLSADRVCAQFFPFSDRPSSAEFICTLAEMVTDRITQK